MIEVDDRVIWFSKEENGAILTRKLVIFGDGSACIEDGGVVEVLFEDDPNVYLDAIRDLKDRGFTEISESRNDLDSRCLNPHDLAILDD